MDPRGRKRDYKRAGRVIRFVMAHPRWTYMRIGGVFGVTRQAIHQLVVSEEKIRGVRLHNPYYRRPHLETCLACRKAIRKLAKDSAWTSRELFPDLTQVTYAYHRNQLKQAGVLEGTIQFWSEQKLKAYRAWRDGASALTIEKKYGYKNWHSALARTAEPCPGVGRYLPRDLRPTWQKDLEGHDLIGLTRYRLHGLARTKKGTMIPYQQTVHARSKRVARANAEITMAGTRGVKILTLAVDEV